MSRHTLQLENGFEFAFGIDRIFGYFCQVFDKDEELVEEAEGRGQVIGMMKKYDIPSDIVSRVALDMPL